MLRCLQGKSTSERLEIFERTVAEKLGAHAVAMAVSWLNQLIDQLPSKQGHRTFNSSKLGATWLSRSPVTLDSTDFGWLLLYCIHNRSEETWEMAETPSGKVYTEI